MLKKGSNIKHRDKINETPLFYAARDTALYFAKKQKNAELIDFLISKGAINTKDGKLTKSDILKY